MKKLLLILLLIVGCDEFAEPEDVETQDEIKEVAWIMVADSLTFSTGTLITPRLYWTEGYKPAVVDTLYQCFGYGIGYDFNPSSYNECIEYCEAMNEVGSWNPDFIVIDCSTIEPQAVLYIYFSQGDSIFFADSVRNIIHFIEPDYFQIIHIENVSSDGRFQMIYPEDDSSIKYEYK